MNLTEVGAASRSRPKIRVLISIVAVFAYLLVILQQQNKALISSPLLQSLPYAPPPLDSQAKPESTTCRPTFDKDKEEWIPVQKDDQQCLLDESASDYIQFLSSVLVGTPLGGTYHYDPDQIGKQPFPYDENLRMRGHDWPPFGYTMIGKARMENFRCAIQEVNRKRVAGAIAELGVWRGGAMMMAAAIGKESGIQRDLYLFDAFEPIGTYEPENLKDFLAVDMESVEKSFQYFGLDGPHLHFEKGLFKDTLPSWQESDASLAVLRIDGNFYDSYQDAMYYLYEKVAIGGIVIFDDILTHQDVMQFWQDFKKDQNITEHLNAIDGDSTWFRKEHRIKIDWTYFRPPQDANKR